MKECTACGVDKPLSEFHKSKATRDGLTYRCKVCAIAIAKSSAEANPERSAANKERWYQRNRSRLLASRVKKPRSRMDPEEKKRRRALYREKNRERLLAEKREQYATNRDRHLATAAKWKRNNPGRVAANNKNRKALVKRQATGGKITAAEWQNIIAIYRGRCAYCRKKPKTITMDHIIPIVRGGAHSISNVVPACQSCNSSKGERLLSEWRPRLPKPGIVDGKLITGRG